MSKEVQIPTGQCQSCRFFSETEDGDRYCAIYNKYWEIDHCDEEDVEDVSWPPFCKVEKITIHEIGDPSA